MNGQPLGLYSQVEEPRAQMLSRFFTDSSGPLYTIHYADFEPAVSVGVRAAERARRPHAHQQPHAGAGDDAARDGDGSGGDVREPARVQPLLGADGDHRALGRVALRRDSPSRSAPTPAPTPIRRPSSSTSSPKGPTTRSPPPTTTSSAWLRSNRRWPRPASRCPAAIQDFVNQVWEILDQARRQLNWVGENGHVAAQIAPLVPMDTRKPYTDADVAMAPAADALLHRRPARVPGQQLPAASRAPSAAPGQLAPRDTKSRS